MPEPWMPPMLLPEDQPAQPAVARGGLAPQQSGGLMRFLQQAADGAEKVLSHPLYARLWSGAVSGQAQDPSAGPRALAQLDANRQNITTQQELMQLRQSQFLQRAAQMQRQQQLEANLRNARTPEEKRAAFYELAPAEAYKMDMQQPKAPAQRKRSLPGGLVQHEEFVGGDWVPVGPPGEPASLVSIDANDGPKLTDVRGLRGDYTTEAARYITGVEQLPMMRANAALGTGAGDLGLIVAVAKIRDPNSVVREGEIDLVREDSSRYEDINLAVKRVNSGQLLLPEQRKRLIESVEAELRSLAPGEEKRRQTFGSIANQYGIDPAFIYGQQSVEDQLRSIGLGPQPSESLQPVPLPPDRAKALGLE